MRVFRRFGLVGLLALATGPLVSAQGRGNQPPPPLVTTSVIVGRVVDAASGKPVAGVRVDLTGGPSRITPPRFRGEPVPALTPAPPLPQILTDAEGRFAFRHLTRGSYSISASKPGYAPGAFGRNRPGEPVRPLQLDDHEKIGDVAIRVFKLGVIAGTILDEAGEPIVGAVVRVYRRTLVSGQRVFVPANQEVTDDRGVYRFSNLMPADYVVSVPTSSMSMPATSSPPPASPSGSPWVAVGPGAAGSGRQLSPDSRFLLQFGSAGSGFVVPDGSGRWRGYATQFYPATRTPAGADVIRINPGDERSAIDLELRFVPVVSVSGQLLGPEGPAVNVALRLMPAETETDQMSTDVIATAVTDASGAFAFLAVPSGQYVVRAVRQPQSMVAVEHVHDAPPASGAAAVAGLTPMPRQPVMTPMLWASAPVSVGDTDVTGIGLAWREGLKLSGRLEFAGSLPRPEERQIASISVVLEPVAGFDAMPSFGPPSRVLPDGRFETAGRPPGKYFVRVIGGFGGWMIEAITVNGRDVGDTPLELDEADATNATIRFTDVIAEVRGTVRRPAADADPPVVVLFPADSMAWKDFGVNPRRLRLARPGGATAAFTFGMLPAGEYLAAAIPEEFSAEWQDPEYLSLIARQAERVSIAAGERRTISLSILNVRPPGAGRAPLRPALRPGLQPTVEMEKHEDGRGPFARDDEQRQQQQPPRDMRAEAPKGTGSISGVVMLDDSGSTRPARLARVTARSVTGQGERGTQTDDDGRYTIAWLPAGDYQVSVTKPAYLQMYVGASRPGVGPGRPTRVAAGQHVQNVSVTLLRGAIVAGTVLDPLGEPASGVRVQLMTPSYLDGERVLAAVSASGTSVTDDRGAFRLYGIRPGAYLLAATPSTQVTTTNLRQLSDADLRAAMAEVGQTTVAVGTLTSVGRPIAPAASVDRPVGPDVGQPVAYLPVFYPGTTDEVHAQPIALVAGQETYAHLQLRLVRGARIEGIVYGPDGQRARNVSVQMSRRSPMLGVSSSNVRNQEGGFQSYGVAPGRYSLFARFTDSPQGVPLGVPPGRTLVAQMDIDVTGEDLTGLSLVVRPAPSLAGRVVFAGGQPPPNPKQVVIGLESTGRAGSATIAPQPVSPDDSGRFVINNVWPGRYRLAAGVNGGGPWTILSSTVGGKDAVIGPFDADPERPITDAVITLTSDPAQLTGRLLDADGRPLAGLTVVLFPVDPALWPMTSTRVHRTSRAADDGAYRFTSIFPGEYFLAVLADYDAREWSDPEFKAEVAKAAITLRISAGEKKVQDVKLR
jgi:protocatechuate 3,4-dioxygenase beta subunit